MKRIILLAFVIITLTSGAQTFYTSGDCKAGFKFDVNYNIKTFAPATVLNFYDLSVGKVKAWYWDFGNGEYSNEQNPIHIFNHPIGGPTVKISPYRTVTLTIVTDSCKSTFSQTINIIEIGGVVQQNCTALFKYFESGRDTVGGTAKIVFNNYSIGKDLKFLWQFGDGTTSTEQNPIVKFSLKETEYKVCLTVSSADSCTSTFCDVVYLKTPWVEPVNCQAHFKYDVTTLDSLNSVAVIKFYNGSVGNDLKYLWQFGDGTTSTEREPFKKFELKQTEYKVCLTITGSNNCQDTYCAPVIPKPVVIIDPVIPACYAAFGYDLKDMLMSPLPSMVASFYSKVYPEAKEYYWSFGDGTTSNEPNPTHIYIKKSDSLSVLNPYCEVCLTVITSDGCKVMTCQKVPVFGSVTPPDPPKYQAAFKYYIPGDIVSIPEVVMVKLMDVTNGEVVKRLWQFENGKTSNEKEPLVPFSIFQPIHKVCLTVTFAGGTESTFCNDVFVKNPVIGPLPPVPVCDYKIKVDGGFPIQMSSCAGWASAKVYNRDGKEATPKLFSWSTGDTVQKISGLCPAKTYTVKALMSEGCVVYAHFILNADGSITPTSPANWSVSGMRDNMYIKTDVSKPYLAEWRLCDGTVVKADSVPLASINCGGSVSNYILKDSLGNVVYSETVSLKGLYTGADEIVTSPQIKLWPNPVAEKLNIRYSGEYQNELKVEMCDIVGKKVSEEIIRNVPHGYEFSINTGSLKQGIYICRIVSESKIISAQKISKK